MLDTILIRPDIDAGTCRWRLTGDRRDSAHGGGTLAEAAAAAPGRPATLLVRGAEVLLTQVRVPIRSRSRARVAVPWALEDRVAEEVEGLHFALGPVVDSNWSVAVVSRTWFAGLLAACAEAGLDVRAAIPEPLALPPPPEDGAWSVLEEPDRITVRTGQASGFACEPALLAVIAALESAPQRIVLRRVAGCQGALWPQGWPSPEVIELGSPGQGMDALGHAADAPLDLLQGAFSRREKHLEALRQWRLPAVLAVALLVVAGGQLAQRYAELGQRQAELQGRIQDVYQQAFPEARATRDPRAQMETRLRALRGDERGDSRFAEVVLRASGVIRDRDGARLAGLTWRDGDLELVVQASELPTLDAVQRGLAERGLAAELRGVDRDDERVSGRLQIREEDS